MLLGVVERLTLLLQLEDQRCAIEAHHESIGDLYKVLESASLFSSHERQHRRAIQRRLDELEGKVDELGDASDGDCDNVESSSSAGIDLAESLSPMRTQRDEEAAVETLFNVDEEEEKAVERLLDVVEEGETYADAASDRYNAEDRSQTLPSTSRGRYDSVSRGTVRGQRARRSRPRPYAVPGV